MALRSTVVLAMVHAKTTLPIVVTATGSLQATGCRLPIGGCLGMDFNGDGVHTGD